MGRVVLALIGLFFCTPVFGAVGVFEWNFTADDGSPPATITYLINCAAAVTIEIRDESDQMVCALGTFQESSGTHTHEWDGSGSSAGHSYHARIIAERPAEGGSQYTLQELFHEQPNLVLYGIAIDKCPSSPGYGTIYASQVGSDLENPGGVICVYHADGTPKNGFGGNSNSNKKVLGFDPLVTDAPWGIGVDSEGNIYAARKALYGEDAIGVKVFNYEGTWVRDVFIDETRGNFWAEGLATSGGHEIYETVGTEVCYASADISHPEWMSAAMGPFPSNQPARQICFDQSGACYVATQRTGLGEANPGVRRFTREPGQNWVRDTGFDCGLGTTANYAVGVSCDAKDPDGEGPCTSSMWIGLYATSLALGGKGNVVRKALPSGTPQYFTGLPAKPRIVAADAVGNVAVEYSTSPDIASKWSDWGLYAPGGEASSDVRVTNEISFAGSESPELVGRITDIRNRPDGSFVELTEAKTVSAVYGSSFYIQETDRSGGVRVEGPAAPAEGSAVKVRGRLTTTDGERVLTQAEIVP